MPLHDPVRDAQDDADVPREIAFAPKELRLANELSERLGYTTVRSPSRSRPTGLSRGHRSVSESEQRRALLLPQELMQMPDDALLVLKAGLPPARGRKIRFYQEAAFRDRVQPPPDVAPLPATEPASLSEEPPSPALPTDPLTLEAIAPALAAEGLEPLPPEGATTAQVEAWVERFIDATAHLPDREARDD